MGGIALFGASGLSDDVDVFMALGRQSLGLLFTATGTFIIDFPIFGAGGLNADNQCPVMI